MMVTIGNDLMALLKRKGLANREWVLLTDDGGGKYSLNGGACSIGTKFTLVYLTQPDTDYPVKVTNNQGLHLWTSNYDLMFLNADVVMDYQQGRIFIKDRAHLLDRAVQLADGAAVLQAFAAGILPSGTGC